MTASGFPSLVGVAAAFASLLVLAGVIGLRPAAALLAGRWPSLLLALPVGLLIQGMAVFLAALAFGFTAWTMGAVLSLLVGAAVVGERRWPVGLRAGIPAGGLAFAVAAVVVALLPALTVSPQIVGDAVRVGWPIYDFGKVAIVDEIARSGLPPANPFIAGADGTSPLAYYYFWYVIAAELRLLLPVSGWEAAIALTWLTALCSLTATAALAVAIGGRSAAAWWVLPLSLGGHVEGLAATLGGEVLRGALSGEPLVQAWPYQSSWVPQHLLSSVAVLLAILALCRLLAARRFDMATSLLLACFCAAALGLSAWVGGIGQAAILPVVAFVLVATGGAGIGQRLLQAAMRLVPAVVLTLLLAVPFIQSQLGALPRVGNAVEVWIYPVFAFGGIGGRLADLAGFWLFVLPLSLPAILFAGLLMMFRRDAAAEAVAGVGVGVLAGAIFACFVAAQFLRSSIANNDLGWRVVLPGILCLAALAAAYMAETLRRDAAPRGRRWAIVALLPATVALFTGLHYFASHSLSLHRGRIASADEREFFRQPALWQAVRRHSAAHEAVLNNPNDFERMTRGPVNIGWALLADRRSCIAGRDWLRAFAPLPIETIDARLASVERFYAGRGTAGDVGLVLDTLRCDLVVVSVGDRLWQAGSQAVAGLTLVEEIDGRWRLYRRVSR